MDPRLKERLIGAAVLVALGVVFVPWVLDGPAPAPSSADLQLPPPAAAESLRIQTIELGRSDAAPAPVAKRNDDARAAVARPDSVAPPTPTRRAEPAEHEAASAKAAATPEASTPGAEPKAASAEPATARPDATPAAGQWAVQLGAFGEEENARRLAARVATYGFDAGVSAYRSGGREMYRVRTGPVDTRGRAEAAASSLTAHGFVAQVVAAN